MAVSKYPKGSPKKLQFDFEACDFDCPCRHTDCTYTLVDDDLALGLQLMRDQLGVPLFIRSAFRCSQHQMDLREQGYETAHGTSQHELGKAADVHTRRHSGDALAEVAFKVGFLRVGLAATWIHCDVKGQDEPRPKLVTVWYYSSHSSKKA